MGVQLTRSDGTKETRYFHSDALGSITAVSNDSGTVLERFGYDAYGKRRLPNGTDGAVTPTTTRRGYTGHEHLDEVGLIHMNGRIYDPQLGRFLSPDPMVSDPGFTQGFNRYAYVYNNPMRLVDPSGFNPIEIFSLSNHEVSERLGIGGYNYYNAWQSSPSMGGSGYGQWTVSNNGLASDSGVTRAQSGFDFGFSSGNANFIGGASGGAGGFGSQATLSGPGSITASGGATGSVTSANISTGSSPTQITSITNVVTGVNIGGSSAGAPPVPGVTLGMTFSFAGSPTSTMSLGNLYGSIGCSVGDFSCIQPQPIWTNRSNPSTLDMVGVGLAAPGLVTGKTALQTAQTLGRQGEILAGIVKNTQRIPSASGTAAYRVPDILNHAARVVGDVKNVASLSYTNQLKDIAAYAVTNGYTFELWVRATTQLSGPLQQAVANGTIVLRFLP